MHAHMVGDVFKFKGMLISKCILKSDVTAFLRYFLLSDANSLLFSQSSMPKYLVIQLKPENIVFVFY